MITNEIQSLKKIEKKQIIQAKRGQIFVNFTESSLIETKIFGKACHFAL